MIRGPVLTLSRDGLWRLVRQRTGLLERGLRIVAEQLELGAGDVAPVDGLARDAAGNPVLLFVAEERDATLPARVLSAHAFWQRNHKGLARALPEADLQDASRCRLCVVGPQLGDEVAQALRRLQLADLEIAEVDVFRVAGQDRVVVHWALGHDSDRAGDPAVPVRERDLLAAFDQFVHRLDPAIRVDGDRFSRRAAFDGHVLGECWFEAGAVHVTANGGAPQRIDRLADLRQVVDALARRYLQLQGVHADDGTAREPAAAGGDEEESAGDGLEAVRASLRAARVTREEREALEQSSGDRDEEGRPAGS